MVRPPTIDTIQSSLSDDIQLLVTKAKGLYMERLQKEYNIHHKNNTAYIVQAPGRVNLIGEHTDYQHGYVLPLAVEYSTIAYGSGHLHNSGSSATSSITFYIISDQFPDKVHKQTIYCVDIDELQPPIPANEEDGTPPPTITWVNYVLGVIVQYIPDLPKQGCNVDIAIAYTSNVPLGSGLSSSASLEIATAVFLECILHDMAYSSSSTTYNNTPIDIKKERALRCQRAENEWALSPCGIMDQMASSCCEVNHCMLLDCKSMDITQVLMKSGTDEDPVLVIANSGVTHAIQADEEYGKRRKECSEAVFALQSVPLYHVESLRDANVADIEEAYEKDKLDDVLYKRSLHVVTENKRVMECKTALKLGLWDKVGTLMNLSQDSMRDNFQISCEEIDYLISVTKDATGVYGTRLTGGGFGGCTVTLVQREHASALIELIQTKYQEQYQRTCNCFITLPAGGAKVLAIDLLSV